MNIISDMRPNASARDAYTVLFKLCYGKGPGRLFDWGQLILGMNVDPRLERQ